MDVAGFVTDNLTAQIDAYTGVLASMNERLDRLDPDERTRIEDASAVLRRSRAGIQKTLPLHVVGPST